MTSQARFRHYARVIQHFASTRAVEVFALQASPIIGGFLGGLNLEWDSVIRISLLLLGSVALTAHVFIFNDWAGRSSDIRDPQRSPLVFARHDISSGQVARVAIAFLVFSNAVFAAIGSPAILIGAAITALSLLYSCSPGFGKITPIAASINHLIGGSLHFLLGYTLFHPLDERGFLISLFFGLVFAGGHLNQEVRDYEGDLLNGVRTSAVAFGCRGTFLASLSLFTAAYALITSLALLGILPKVLLGSAIVWCLHVAWSLQALRRGLGFETALWMQGRYRLLFALIGFAMLIR